MSREISKVGDYIRIMDDERVKTESTYNPRTGTFATGRVTHPVQASSLSAASWYNVAGVYCRTLRWWESERVKS